MTGLFLVLFLSVALIFVVISFIDTYNDTDWRIASIVSLCLGVLWMIAIPISRIDSKVNAEYCKVLQETVNKNRENQQDLNVLERAAIIEEINECNEKITTWKIKGQKWYNNKWYYHPSTQQVEYVK